jgi:hypothetical protein
MKAAGKIALARGLEAVLSSRHLAGCPHRYAPFWHRPSGRNSSDRRRKLAAPVEGNGALSTRTFSHAWYLFRDSSGNC